MSGRLEFTHNYSDLGTNQGFQFEFYCDRCHNGFRSRFKPNLTGAVSGVMDAANSLFGGVFGKAARLTWLSTHPPLNPALRWLPA